MRIRCTRCTSSPNHQVRKYYYYYYCIGKCVLERWWTRACRRIICETYRKTQRLYLPGAAWTVARREPFMRPIQLIRISLSMCVLHDFITRIASQTVRTQIHTCVISGSVSREIPIARYANTWWFSIQRTRLDKSKVIYFLIYRVRRVENDFGTVRSNTKRFFLKYNRIFFGF